MCASWFRFLFSCLVYQALPLAPHSPPCPPSLSHSPLLPLFTTPLPLIFVVLFRLSFCFSCTFFRFWPHLSMPASTALRCLCCQQFVAANLDAALFKAPAAATAAATNSGQHWYNNSNNNYNNNRNTNKTCPTPRWNWHRKRSRNKLAPLIVINSHTCSLSRIPPPFSLHSFSLFTCLCER